MVDEIENAWQGAVQNIARPLVGVQSHADGIGDIHGSCGQFRVEFADQERLVRGLREEKVDRIEVRPGHREDPGAWLTRYSVSGWLRNWVISTPRRREDLHGVHGWPAGHGWR